MRSLKTLQLQFERKNSSRCFDRGGGLLRSQECLTWLSLPTSRQTETEIYWLLAAGAEVKHGKQRLSFEHILMFLTLHEMRRWWDQINKIKTFLMQKPLFVAPWLKPRCSAPTAPGSLSPQNHEIFTLLSYTYYDNIATRVSNRTLIEDHKAFQVCPEPQKPDAHWERPQSNTTRPGLESNLHTNSDS